MTSKRLPENHSRNPMLRGLREAKNDIRQAGLLVKLISKASARSLNFPVYHRFSEDKHGLRRRRAKSLWFGYEYQDLLYPQFWWKPTDPLFCNCIGSWDDVSKFMTFYAEKFRGDIDALNRLVDR